MLTALLISVAFARPTEGGQYAFDDADVVTSLDSPNSGVRVWYSTEGPSVVLLDDADDNGLPDFAELVAAQAEDVVATYAEAGFRPPVADGVKGGSDAMDAYLVDFAGKSDGQFVSESCDGAICSGYFVMENDFQGYGYPDVPEAVRVLTSHELFHAVQAAYNATSPVWFSEGTAVWAERFYDPDNSDFLSFCDAYLTDTGRSLDEPPAGPVPTFAYATALWWWYLSEQYGVGSIADLLDRSADGEEILAAMAEVEAQGGGTIEEDWSTFARWNLATGSRAGAAASYTFAADLREIRIRSEDASISDDNRFYPLAASYYSIQHPGGDLRFAIEESAPNLAFSVHAADAEGRALDALQVFPGENADLGDQPAGTYWLVGSNPTLDTQSTKRLICFGGDVSACGVPDSGGGSADSGAAASPTGCGCAMAHRPPASAALSILGLVGLAGRRRRR